ncbi:MAG: hypothetical protein N3A54_04780 [Patescibacteria group bacterium]|nr:hypothetical protein [Patescibacteria group bacterium]
MSITITTEKTEFIFTQTFDVVIGVKSSVSGKIFFFVESDTRGGFDIPPLIVVKAGEESKISARIYSSGNYRVYCKINNNGIFEESNVLFFAIKEMAKELATTIKETEGEEKKKVDLSSDSIRPSIFFSDKEKNFQKQIATELVERVVNEFVFYFPIIVDNYHSLYGESLIKYYEEPIRLPCLVEWKGNENKNEKFSLDIVPTIVVHVLKRRAEEDLGLKIMVGDFIQYGRDFFEIVAVESPNKLFYSFNFYVELDLTCVKARTGLFFLESTEQKNGY